MDLNNKTVIVTGAGSGIGRALALEFARHGANVVCTGRRADRLDETARLIRDEAGSALPIPADITNRDHVRSLVLQTLDRFAAIDVVFNNAGSFQSIAGVFELDPDLWWHDVTVNALGPLLLIRETLPLMMQCNQGVIINMNGGRPVGGSGYACGKAALQELTRLMAEELKIENSSVMVFFAGPGLVRTEMTELQVNSPAGRKWIPSTKECFDSGKLRQPQDIARKTIELLRIAQPHMSGKSYGPTTDLSTF